MIQFDFDWSEPINQLILLLAAMLLFMQLWLLAFKNRPVFTARLILRLGLNILLWAAIMAFILQPYLSSNSQAVTGIITGKDIPAEFRDKLKDSLKTADLLDSDLESLQDLPGLFGGIDTLILAGQDFQPELFEEIMQAEPHPAIKWISYSAQNQVQNLNWKAVLRKGEIQSIRGIIQSSKKQVLKLRYGNQIPDSTLLHPGSNAFTLTFPVFTQGRTSAELVLENTVMDTIRFFARPAELLTFQFILDNPDFESRSLATWLGKNGHSVLYTTTLSKDIKSKLTVNKAKDPDVLITDPGNASNAQVKKAVPNGKSVLFINFTNPPSEINTVNAVLGTKLQIRKISNEAAVTLSPELTALPYHFIPSNHYLLISGYPAAVEKTSGIIGVSLFNETFPLLLNGDSVTYQKVWSSVLASVHPASQSNIAVQAPVYSNLKTTVNFNNFPESPELFRMGTDTLFPDYSVLNNRSASSSFMPLQAGWISSPDSSGIELFVESRTVSDPDYNTEKVKNFIRSYTSYQTVMKEAMIGSDESIDKGIRKKVSDWVWFGIVMICLAGVWVEQKL